jgi:hypothetical protein
MTLQRFFSKLFRRGSDDSQSTPHAASRLLADTRTSVDAEALALQAAVDVSGPQAESTIKGVEELINTAYAGLLTRTEALFAPAIGRLEAQLSHLLARTAPERLDAVERDCAVELTRLHTQSRPLLVAAKRSERSQRLALRAFRYHHKLNREARYPESRALHFSALAFVCVIEALANTFAFAQGSNLGILGGLAQALLIAAVNVVFAFFAGRIASGLFHRNWGIKSLAASLVGGWAVFESLYALTVAHYRIALLNDVDTASWVALKRLQTMPLTIDDVTSVLLTVFTLAFGVAALLTGLATDDRFPGFGARTRAHKATRTRLETLRQNHLGAIDAIYLPGPTRLMSVTAEAVGITDTYRHTVERLKHTAAALEHALGEVSAAYRQAVLSAREAFVNVTGRPLAASTLAPLPQGNLLTQTLSALGEADRTLTTFPARLARLEVERAAAVTRLQQRHAAALEATPAFFAKTDQLAETEFDQDEQEAVQTLGRQHSLWDETNAECDVTGQRHGEDEPALVSAVGPGVKTDPTKGNGSEQAKGRAH